jgi:hypothetical protein
MRSRDARVMAMGGAFTAVADDVGALYYNPAGLAYLSKGNLKLGGSVLLDLNAQIVKTMEELYEYDPADELGFDFYRIRYQDGTGAYVDENYNGYYDSGEYLADLEGLGFEESWEGFDMFLSWYDGFYPMAKLFNEGLDEFKLLPNISYTSPGFGVGLLGQASLVPAVVEWNSEQLLYGFNLNKQSGVIGGLGFALGPVAVGGNIKYYKQSITPFGIPSASFDEFRQHISDITPGIPENQALAAVLLQDAAALPGANENHLEVGVGIMGSLGAITVGGYVDSILGIVLDDSGEVKKDIMAVAKDAMKTANIGVALDPSSRKSTGREPLLNLIASADLKNIGDDENRFFNVGAEVGIHLGRLVQADVRAGYKQFLTGPLDMLLESDILDIDRGEFSVGIGLKAVLVEMNIALTAPTRLIEDLAYLDPASFESEDDLTSFLAGYGENFPRFMISFGVDL